MDGAIEWLLDSPEPAVARLARRDLLGENVASELPDGPIVRGLLDADPAGHPYKKWAGAHWRLVSLVELGLEHPEPRALAAVEQVLGWADQRRASAQHQDDRRAHAALRVAGRERTRGLLPARPRRRSTRRAAGGVADRMAMAGRRLELRQTRNRLSLVPFNESLPPMWGLHEYFRATGDAAARDAARRTAELLLEHRLFRTLGSGEVIHRSWLVPHYPPYWHYEGPQALLILSRLELVADPRAGEAIDALLSRRRPDGTWRAGAAWWRAPGRRATNVECVDWGDVVPHQLVTLNALRIFAASRVPAAV